MIFIIWNYSSLNQETSSSKIFLNDEGDQFLRNVEKGLPNDVASYLRRV